MASGGRRHNVIATGGGSVLPGEAYWRSIIHLEGLTAAGMVDPVDLGLARFAETPEGVWTALFEGGAHAGAAPRWEASDIRR